MSFDDNLGAMLRETRVETAKQPAAAGSTQNRLTDADFTKILPGQALVNSVERQLPPFPRNMTAKDGDWQIINGTR